MTTHYPPIYSAPGERANELRKQILEAERHGGDWELSARLRFELEMLHREAVARE